MKYGKVLVEQREAGILNRLFSFMSETSDVIQRASVGKLARELTEAEIRTEQEMPQDVVRLNSVVTIRMQTGKEQTFTLVLPSNSDISKNKLSLLAPMGLALFGYAQHDSVLWEFPAGQQEIVIVKVEQSKEQ